MMVIDICSLHCSPEIISIEVTQSAADSILELPSKPVESLDLTDAILDRLEAPNVRYKCRHIGCDLNFKRQDQLHSHEYTHTAQTLFHCTLPNCTKSYRNNAHLKRHIRVAHLAQSTLVLVPCKHGPECSRSYKSKEKMLAHYQKVHVDKSDIKSLSFSCDLCDAVFRRKAQYRQHMFGHTKQYPYTCQHCQRGFMNRYNLVRHENSHRIYSCTECPDKFLKWSLLVAHRHTMHTTTESKCTVCGRQFQSKRGLKHHRVVHNEQNDRETLQCPHDKCPRYFFHQRNLNAHIRSKHDGIKFICDFEGCGKTLCSKQKLVHHMNVIHLRGPQMDNQTPPKARRVRSDKGLSKESTAAKLANIQMPKEIDRLVMADKGHQLYFEYDDDSIQDTFTTGCDVEFDDCQSIAQIPNQITTKK